MAEPLRILIAEDETIIRLDLRELLAHVWDENANPYTKTVRVTIATLRRKLAAPGQSQPIETVIGSGYRLKAEPCT